ncbi:MAG TPA: lipoprotein-releasing ABC transporter permease subunit [Steroidobacteraceae bacterium]|jgi:lipoprotein-releasing system permease protein|nr:lipoprotein-releasing ABC transporter permease subunit [Steroidobacteraceae bacterium]
MFQPLSVFIGLRYVRSRQHKFFVSLITWVSLAGVGLGVAALIVILSVMNGFEGDLRSTLLSLSAHARVTAQGVPAADANAALAARLRRLPGVVGVAPYIDLTALVVHQTEMQPITLRGVDPAQETAVADVRPYLVEGDYSTLEAGSNAVILGRDVADQLGVRVGDAVTVLVPMVSGDRMPEPRLRQFTVGGVFSSELPDHDNTLVLADIDDVRAFAPQVEGASGLRLRFTDAMQVTLYMPAVRAATGSGFEISDWTQDNASYFRAIRIEKTMMSLILLLIVAVAAFNIVAMLVMVVNDKRTDIAILRTLGASPGSVLRTFMTQGLVIGWFGVGVGVLLGVLLASHVTSIVPALESLFHFQLLDSNVYYNTDIPSQLRTRDVLWISLAALILTLCSTLYPAVRAARTPPADALRYE